MCSQRGKREREVGETVSIKEVSLIRSLAEGRRGEKEALFGRDTWIASVIWEEWEDGTRDHVDKLMARR